MMTDKTELAVLLTLAAGVYKRRVVDVNDHELLVLRCHQLNKLGVLSSRAIAAIVGSTVWQVDRYLMNNRPRVRGTLNPSHLGMLGYALSIGTMTIAMLELMLEGGTSLIMIARLTQIPERTLRRQKKLIKLGD